MLAANFKISIKTLQHLEDVLAHEIKILGGTKVEVGNRIVHCSGDLSFMYKANLHLRSALRVLVPIVEFPIRDADYIYTQAMKTDWTMFLDLNQTFAIDPNVHSEFIKHSNYASVKFKDAIADCFNKKYGKRPNVNPTNPDVLFNLHVDNHRVTISLDSSGESLNRRGYRSDGAQAPLNEVLAAGMILLSGWNAETDLYDPMCGSGTLSIEAAMIAQNLPAQFLRKHFGFHRWKNYDSALYQKIKNEAQENIVMPAIKIYASDIDRNQLQVAKENIENAGFEDIIQIGQSDFLDNEPQSKSGILLFNPPYGERMQEADIDLLYKKIGDHLKHHWHNHSAWIISSNDQALKNVGLKPSKKLQLINGTFLCKYQRFDIFSGSRKDYLSV